ncbi:MAG TPA: DegQ family serine endoprotease [Dissulfurispiraceae bacterium]|nr:DegQ family serine endoprotease [Dissulfurispiraceae bacterium]
MVTKKRVMLIAIAFAMAGVIAGLGMSIGLNLNSPAYSEEPKISRDAIDVLSRSDWAMAEVAAAVKPAVVNISSTRTVKTQGMVNPFNNDPFFKRFFGDQFGGLGHPREFKQASLGSGVIVDRDGYILTNNHVVKDADEIKIRLADKREFKGKVIGTDPKTDLAVVKIEAHRLPILKIGDSDKIKVGETVLAIGTPFGLNQTVTSGIVSAVGRANVGIADYEDFIQTDAAINPGNSGGALVNIHGELIGINTAIFSTSGGYQGIGFAIPSNMAKTVMSSLIKSGKVVRGWLGVSIQPVTPDLAKQFNLKEDAGVLVGDVTEDSPAEKAGIKRGDVITEFNGTQVSDAAALRNTVAAIAPNTSVIVKLLRDGKPVSIKVNIGELPVSMQKLGKEYDNLLKGVQVQDISPEIRKELNIPKQISGVVVTDIDESSSAEGVLTRGDVVLQINKMVVKTVKDYEKTASSIKAGEDILLLIYRNGSTFYATISAH